MGLPMVIFGTAGALAGLCGYLFNATREAETLLPDHSQPVTDLAAESLQRRWLAPPVTIVEYELDLSRLRPQLSPESAIA